MPSDPKQELLVALAGPAVNIVLALGLYGGLALSGASAALHDASALAAGTAPFLVRLLWTNVALAVFNLIPAFPMDGGRVLRAALSLRMDHLRATDVAARVGQTLAIGFGLIGLFVNPFLVVIAVFVWVGAQSEAMMTHVHADLSGIPVSSAMVASFAALPPDATVREAAALTLQGFQQDTPVVSEGKLVGMLSRADLLRATLQGAGTERVEAVMRRDADSLRDDESLDVAMDRLLAAGAGCLPVVKGGTLVGMLPLENVMHVLRARESARAAAR
jgi:CBS domain-containing protein